MSVWYYEPEDVLVVYAGEDVWVGFHNYWHCDHTFTIGYPPDAKILQLEYIGEFD